MIVGSIKYNKLYNITLSIANEFKDTLHLLKGKKLHQCNGVFVEQFMNNNKNMSPGQLRNFDMTLLSYIDVRMVQAYSG